MKRRDADVSFRAHGVTEWFVELGKLIICCSFHSYWISKPTEHAVLDSTLHHNLKSENFSVFNLSTRAPMTESIETSPMLGVAQHHTELLPLCF